MKSFGAPDGSGAGASGPTLRIADREQAGQVVVLSGPHAGKRFSIEQSAVIGRDEAADIPLVGVTTVSRRHAEIRKQPNGVWMLQDLESSNGTSLNGKPVEQTLLRFGDKVRFGADTVVLFGRHDPLEEQLFEAQRQQLLGQLAAGIAHDFNNVLGSIILNAEVLAAPSEVDADEARQCASDIRGAAEHAATLIRQLLTFAAPRPDEERSASVNDAAAQVVRLLSRTAPRTVAFEVEAEPDCVVACEASLLVQVLTNLCVNAVHASPDGGFVRIRARRLAAGEGHGERIRIDVEDVGMGMDEATMRRAFEPFFSTRSRDTGTGLGLATVAKIVREHQGEVRLHSELGQGTRVEVVLPVPSGKPRARSVTATDIVEASTSGTVLVVDDDVALRAAATRALVGGGLEVMAACNGSQAVEVFRARGGQIDLVIMDLDMPVMDGETAFAELRALDPEATVIIATGKPEDPAVERLLAAGASSLLTKPFDGRKLLSAALGAMSAKRD